MIKVYIKENHFCSNQEISEEERQKLIDAGFLEIELNDKYSDCSFLDFDNWSTFNEEKYNTRKEKEEKELYCQRVVNLIRQKYTVNDEFQVLRERDENPEAFEEYDAYVKKCKEDAVIE